MICKYHSDKKAVSKCLVCGADLCEDCANYQNEFDSCPLCAKIYASKTFITYKNNLTCNLISIVCSMAFLTLYIVSLCTNKLNTIFIIIGAIAITLLLPISIILTINSAKKIKVYRKLVENALKKEK